MEPNLGSIYHRQEKPVLQDPPESAPAGIVVLPFVEIPPSISSLFTSGLAQALQIIDEMSEVARILSNCFWHLLQANL
jgi:hypothetical protein